MTTNEKESFVLFYSEKCMECVKFIKLLKEYPDLNSCFQKIDIENGRVSLPQQLTHIPGIVVGNQLIMGPNAFKWLGENTKKYFSSGPDISFKGGGMNNFSFIGDDEQNYSKKYTFWNEKQDTIDPNKFDSRSGEPKKDEKKLPPALQPQQVSKSEKTKENDLSRLQEQRASLLASGRN